MEDQARESVERLYLRLADSLQRNRRDAFTAPVTVAEIYQELVPYRAVRSEVGFGMNADYEHALLRLLSGEGGYARLEPGDAASAILTELQSPNPNVGLYRTYAGCDVWIAKPAGLAEAEPPLVSQASADWIGLDALKEDTNDDDAAPFVPPPAPPTTNGVTHVAAPEPESSRSHGCRFCDSTLPTHRSVRFCPFCGADQTLRPCGSCGEAVEPGWAFCVTCGATSTG